MTDHRSIARREALAYRIWSIAEPNGWNITLRDIADTLGESIHRVRGAIRMKNWQNRLPNAYGTNAVDFVHTHGMLGSEFDGPPRLARGDMDATLWPPNRSPPK